MKSKEIHIYSSGPNAACMERVHTALQPNCKTWSQRGGKRRGERATEGLDPDSRGAMAAKAAACIAKNAISKTNKRNPIPGAAHAGVGAGLRRAERCVNPRRL